jgi:long-subunit acyl-CoA synthetase (AMP-forming)
MLQFKEGWSWKQSTWLDFEREVRDAAAFLYGIGFRPGDRAIVLYPNRKEAFWSEVAVLMLGGVVVCASSVDDLQGPDGTAKGWEAVYLFSSSDDAIRGVKEMASRIPSIKRTIVYESDVPSKEENAISFKAMLKFGALKRRSLDDEITALSHAIGKDSPAVVLTHACREGSRTLSHGEIARAASMAARTLSFLSQEDQAFSYLPTTSPFSVLANWIGICIGMRTAMAESRKEFYEDVLEVKPTVVLATSRGLEDIATMLGSGGKTRGKDVRRMLGGRLRHIVTDLPPRDEVGRFFMEAGASITVLDEPGSLV